MMMTLMMDDGLQCTVCPCSVGSLAVPLSVVEQKKTQSMPLPGLCTLHSARVHSSILQANERYLLACDDHHHDDGNVHEESNDDDDDDCRQLSDSD